MTLRTIRLFHPRALNRNALSRAEIEARSHNPTHTENTPRILGGHQREAYASLAFLALFDVVDLALQCRHHFPLHPNCGRNVARGRRSGETGSCGAFPWGSALLAGEPSEGGPEDRVDAVACCAAADCALKFGLQLVNDFIGRSGLKIRLRKISCELIDQCLGPNTALFERFKRISDPFDTPEHFIRCETGHPLPLELPRGSVARRWPLGETGPPGNS